MIDENNRCPNCIWFDRMDPKGGGLCRRSAPVVIPRSETTLSNVGDKLLATKAHTSFPYVRASDWCGDHELDTTL